MKKLFAVIGVFFLFTACTQKKLDKETALEILQDQEGYPKIIDIDVFVGDPAFAKRLIDAGLEKDGYVKIAHTQKLIEVGQPIITFTEKAKPYLIPQTEEDRKNSIQRVKVATKVIDKILNVELANDGKSASVEFKSLFKDRTPFFGVSRIGEKDESVKKVRFLWDKRGWSTD